MGIELVTGVPGGGKSYFAANKLLDVYKSKNRQIYTNVNLKISYDDYIKPLSVQDLYEFATKELALFQKFTKFSEDYKKHIEDETYDIALKGDESLPYSDVFHKREFSKYYGNYDKYLKDSNLLEHFGGSYIVWDECQNDLQSELGKSDPVWIRFFSYHRHFNMDIFLITQDASLIPKRYRAFISRYYFAQNPAKRLISTTLRFKVYTDLRQFEKFYIETISLKMNDEVHNFYDSGEYNPAKSVFLKKILPAIFLFIAMGFLFYFMFYSKTQEVTNESIQENNVTEINTTSYQNNSSSVDDELEINDNEHLLRFRCNLENCVLENSSFSVPLEKFKLFSDATQSTILFSSKLNDYMSDVVIMVNESVYDDLNRYVLNSKGDKHEKGGDTFNSPFSVNR